MSDAVEIAFRADLSDLESGAEQAAELLRKCADELARGFEQASLKEVAIAEDRNNALYRLGQESLDQWRSDAIAEADAKYAAELQFLDRKAAADKNDAAAEVRDLQQRRVAYEDHVLALQKIDERYAQEKQAREREALADAIAADNARLASALKALDTEFRTHQIGADERYRLEQTLTQQIYGEELKRVDALIATLAEGTKAYEDAIRQRQKIEQEFERRSETNTSRLEEFEAQKWTQLGNSIKSSFNSAIDGMLFQGRTFGQGMLTIAEGIIKAFLQMGETIAENWIETQIASLFETKATQTTSSLGQITDAAAVAGANTFASTAAIPVIGPELAPGAAAAAIAQVMGYTSLLALDVGAWNLRSDMPALLHKGEMVVPENFASGLRGGKGLGGDTYHFNTDYHPSWSGRDPMTPQEFFRNNHNEIIGEIKRLVRNGSLAF
ncbi:MAG TPA: hypothetical protein VHT03_01570 [Rhizomicrobium sp.]|jgi:hypothetical protein|nr:hypothetical protein [Rhizomicrobium sp.]